MNPQRTSNLGFAAWIVGGVVWVIVTQAVRSAWQSYFPEYTFHYVNPTPEQATRARHIDNLQTLADCLATGSIAYGLLGIVLFRRRGCVVYGIAFLVVFLSALTIGHL